MANEKMPAGKPGAGKEAGAEKGKPQQQQQAAGKPGQQKKG
jgi:hypothetical protein